MFIIILSSEITLLAESFNSLKDLINTLIRLLKSFASCDQCKQCVANEGNKETESLL